MRRLIPSMFLIAITTLAVSSAAWAHTTVSPERASAGSTEVFTVSAPGERPVPIVEERVEIPERFEVIGVSSPGGWRGRVEGGSVVWAGGEIPEGEEQRFTFEARVPEQTGEYRWRAFDTYEDGSVSEWVGAPDSENPASATKVVAGGASDEREDEHGSEAPGSHADGLPETGGLPPGVLPALAAVLLAAGFGGLLLGRRPS